MHVFELKDELAIFFMERSFYVKDRNKHGFQTWIYGIRFPENEQNESEIFKQNCQYFLPVIKSELSERELELQEICI